MHCAGRMTRFVIPEGVRLIELWVTPEAIDRSLHYAGPGPPPRAPPPSPRPHACLNNRIQDPDGLGELWMETSNRAVAHYGSTVPSYTIPNHELDRGLFKAVFDTGLIVHAQALEAAENQMVAHDPSYGLDNAWMYLLLGDPEMRIRRGGPLVLAPSFPDEIEQCIPGPRPCDPLRIVVRDDFGRPVPEALVSVFKAGPNGQDEVLVTRYADPDGAVSLEIAPSSSGELHVGVRDADGNSSMDVIRVR